MITQTQNNNSSTIEKLKPKFVKRADLTPKIREHIAHTGYSAQILGLRGVITNLAIQYHTSRFFIYILINMLKEAMLLLFSSQPKTVTTLSLEYSLSFMLALRFEGRCSIDAISTIMKRFGVPYNSVGSVSQNLSRIGNLLPNTVKLKTAIIHRLIFASDEIFIKSRPILITVDPISTLILRIELSKDRIGDTWSKHFEEIQQHGMIAEGKVSDEGTGIRAAQKETLADVDFQPDTYHCIPHKLGEWVRRLHKNVATATKNVEERERVFDSSKSDKVGEKKLLLYEEAYKKEVQAIQIYEDFLYLYQCLIEELNIFSDNGNLRNRTQAEKNIETALDLIEELNHSKITKKVVSIRKILPDLLNYYDYAEIAVKNCQKLDIDTDVFEALYLAWQWHKVVIKSKNIQRKHNAIKERNFYIEYAKTFLKEEFDVIKEKIYAELNSIIRSSSIVECVNSILRPYLNNSKNQITQGFLNTFMFYFNHRRYHAGERKGKVPMEIGTGQKQEKDWIQLLLKEIS